MELQMQNELNSDLETQPARRPLIKRFDLSSGELAIQPLDLAMQRDYLGGIGLAARLMADAADFSLPPLDPHLPLVITVGPLTNTIFPGANRACFFGVSPLTGITAPSWLGGRFSSSFARTGTMALILENRALQPSIVVMREDGIEVLSRPDLWGLTVSQTREVLLRDYPTMESAVIGPAGERLVSLASVMGDNGHAAGRAGFGAVLGAKNVKAILAGGSARPCVANPEALKVLSRQAFQSIRESSYLNGIQGPLGTPNLVRPVNDFHAFPTANFQERYFPTAELLYGERIAKEYVDERTTCPTCPVRCRLHVCFGDEHMEAPEYETLWAFGGDNRIDDYPLIVRANYLCNDLGLDTISAGNIVAFYREYSGTLDDSTNVLDLIRQIAYRQGVGDILAQGSRQAAAIWGVDYAMHVKGLEIAGYDPRKLTGMGISYSTANRGGDHTRAWTVGDEMSGADLSGEDLARLVAAYHDSGCVKDSLIMCTFLHGAVTGLYASALEAVIGVSFSSEDLAKTGERIYTLERCLNIRRGIDASQDVLPRRLLEGMVSPDKYRDGMKSFYQLRSWDMHGLPTAEKLDDLGLGFLR
jgi:aldehyde:ferredoxin oxidoreductase